MEKENIIIVHTDGGSRGNPGEAALGVHITTSSGEQLAGFGKRLGIATNNTAEYRALLASIDWLLTHQDVVKQYDGITFRLDSELLVKQITGIYKVKSMELKGFYMQVIEQEKRLGVPVLFEHVRREFNKEADAWVNKALDNLL